MRDSIPSGSVAIYQRESSTVYRVPPDKPRPPTGATEGPDDRHEIWKVLRAGASARDRDRHRTEYLLLRRLQRLHWPTVYDFRILNDGAGAIVMEEVGGVALSEMRFPTGFGIPHLQICHQILAALDMLHWTGHAHADLKPDHVFIDQTPGDVPRVTLIDLGYAVPFGERVRTGTVPNIPPEILLEDEPWSAASDHYLFGLVLYHLVTGMSPRSEKDHWEEGWLETVLPEVPRDTPAGLIRLLESLLGPINERPTRAIQIWSTLREMFPQYSDATERLLHESEPDTTKLPPFPMVGRLQETRRFESQISPIEMKPGRTIAHYHIAGEIGSGRRTLMGHFAGIAETRGWRRLDPNDPSRLGFESEDTTVRLELHVESLPTIDLPTEPSTESKSVAPNTGGAREVRFQVRVEPLAAAEMEALARTRVESPRIIARTAQVCLGNPGLLEALLPTIPRLMDFVSRDFPGAWNEFEYEKFDPPLHFIEFAAAIGAILSPSLCRLCSIIAIVDSQWDYGPLAEMVESTDSWMQLMAPTAYPGLFDPTSAAPRFSSPLWRTAWLRAHREECRDLAEQVLSSISPAATGDQLADACRVAIELELWEDANQLLDRSLRKLHEVEMYTRELDLLRCALDRVPESELRIPAPRFAAVAEIIQLLPFDAGQALPGRFAEGRVPARLKKDLQRTLIAAALSGRGQLEHALRVLGPIDDLSDRSTSLEGVVLYVRCKDLLNQTQPIDWLLGLGRLPKFSSPRARAILRFAALRFKRLSPALFLQLTQEADSLVGIDGGLVEGLLANFRTSAFFQEQNLEAAMIQARRAEEILRNLEARTPHTTAIQHLAGISYEKARLSDAYTYGRLYVRQNLAAGLVTQPLLQMSNQVLCALDRGRFDLALMETESIRGFVSHREMDLSSLQNAEARIASYAGLLELLPDRSDDLTLYTSIALTHLIAGDAAMGRAALEQIKGELVARRSMDDVAELVLDWLLAETDLGNADQALSLWVDLDAMFEVLSPRARLKLLVAQNTLTLADWIDAPDDLESLLSSTLEALRSADYGFLVWRACWHLAEFNLQKDRTALHARWRDEGQRLLRELARGLSRTSWRASFLQLPAQRRFLAT